MPGTSTVTPTVDPAQQVLAGAAIPQQAKADLWEQFNGAKDENDLATRLQNYDAPQQVKADLWEAKKGASAPVSQSDQYFADKAAGTTSPDVAARHARAANPNSKNMDQPPDANGWDAIGPSLGLRDAQDYLNRQRDAAETSNLASVAAQPQRAPTPGHPVEQPVPTTSLKARAYDAAARGAGALSGLTRPNLKNAAYATGFAIAPPVTGAVLAAENAKDAYQGRGTAGKLLDTINAAKSDPNWQPTVSPDEAESAIMPYAGIAGGTAGALGGIENFKNAVKSSPTKDADEAYANAKAAHPPTPKETNYDDAMQRARPYEEAVAAQNPVKGPQATRTARDNANQAIGEIEDKVGDYIKGVPNAKIDSGAVTKAASDALDAGTFTPEEKAQGMKSLDGFGLDQDLPLADADPLRKRFGSDAQAIYGGSTASRASMRTSNPVIVAKEAAADALRTQVYSTLEDAGVPGIDELRKDEGALIQRRNVYERNIVRSEKPNPPTTRNGLSRIGSRRAAQLAGGSVGSLLGPIGAGVGVEAGNYIGNKLEEYQNSKYTPNALIEKSFAKRVTNGVPTPPPVPVQPQPRQAVAQLPAAPAGGLTNRAPIAIPPKVTASGPVPLEPPTVAPTTRAERLGLLLPAAKTPLVTPPTTAESTAAAYRPETSLGRNAKTGRVVKQTGTLPEPELVGQTAEGGPIKVPAPSVKTVRKAAGPFPARLTADDIRAAHATLQDPTASATDKVQARQRLAQDNGMNQPPSGKGKRDVTTSKNKEKQ